MKRKIGLWIDHRKALIVSISGPEMTQSQVISHVERQLCRSGDRPLRGPYQAEQVPAGDRQKRAYQAHLNNYYDSIIAGLREAESVLVFGPGPAKTELVKRMKRTTLKKCHVILEPADKMTERQVRSKVRDHFESKAA